MKPDFSLEHYDDLQHLLANGFLEQSTFAHAVALQTINLGIGSLTDGQRSRGSDHPCTEAAHEGQLDLVTAV